MGLGSLGCRDAGYEAMPGADENYTKRFGV